jgi:hypothetical protein
VNRARIEEEYFPSELPVPFLAEALRAKSRYGSVPRLRAQDKLALKRLGIRNRFGTKTLFRKKAKTLERMHVEMHAQIDKGRKPQPVGLGQSE